MSPRFSFISPENVLPPHKIVCIIQYKEQSFQTVPFMEGKNIYIYIIYFSHREVKKRMNMMEIKIKINNNKKENQASEKAGGRRKT